MNATSQLLLLSIATLCASTNVILVINSYLTRRYAARRISIPAVRLRTQVAAYSIDVCIVLPITLLLAASYDAAAALVSPTLMFLVSFLYAYVLYATAGRTLGQMMMKLRRPLVPSFNNMAVSRAVIGFLLIVFGLFFGFLSAFLDAEHRTVDEKIVGLRFSTDA